MDVNRSHCPFFSSYVVTVTCRMVSSTVKSNKRAEPTGASRSASAFSLSESSVFVSFMDPASCFPQAERRIADSMRREMVMIWKIRFLNFIGPSFSVLSMPVLPLFLEKGGSHVCFASGIL